MTPRLGPAPEVVWFRGPDALRFVNDLISQEIGATSAGSVARSLLLGPQGKLDFILWALRGDEEVGLVTEDGRGDELQARLARYRIRVDVNIEAESRPVALVIGEVTVPSRTWEVDDGSVTADLSWDTLPRELRIGADLPALEAVDPDEYDRERIAAGIPVMGIDVDEGTIPQETGLVPETVSFDKGCFLGQELVARLDSRGGRVNRHLRRLEFDSPVPVGTTLVASGREVGTVTTSSGGRGLALVWRDVGPGDRVEAGGVGATVREVPHKTERAFTGS